MKQFKQYSTPARSIWILSTLMLVYCVSWAAGTSDVPGTPEKEIDPKEKFRYSVVAVRSHTQKYNWLIPWNKNEVQRQVGSALVLNHQKLLTTAELVANHTLIEVKRADVDQPFEAEVLLVDYAVNLALLHVKDPQFWHHLEPVQWGQAKLGEATIYNWKGPNDWEVTPSSVKQLRMGFRAKSEMRIPVLDVNAGLKSQGQGNAIVQSDKVVGMGMVLRESGLTGVPAQFLQAFLDRTNREPYRPFAHTGFEWQRVPQDTVREYLKIPVDQSGVLLSRILPYGTGSDVLKTNDFLVAIAGSSVSNEGKIDHPKWGKVLFQYLFSGDLNKADSTEIEVIRDGKRQKLITRLTSYPPDAHFVPLEEANQRPHYVLRGGLLFQELTISYLKIWGKDWTTQAPPRLNIYRKLGSTLPENKDRRIVQLTRVLPTSITIGFQNLTNVVVTQINGKEIHRLQDVVEAFNQPKEGFHKIQFLPGSGRDHLILPDAELEATNQQVLKNFQIPQLEVLE